MQLSRTRQRPLSLAGRSWNTSLGVPGIEAPALGVVATAGLQVSPGAGDIRGVHLSFQLKVNVRTIGLPWMSSYRAQSWQAHTVCSFHAALQDCRRRLEPERYDWKHVTGTLAFVYLHQYHAAMTALRRILQRYAIALSTVIGSIAQRGQNNF